MPSAAENDRRAFERAAGLGSSKSKSRSQRSLRTRSIRSRSKSTRSRSLKSRAAAPASAYSQVYSFLPSANRVNTPYPMNNNEFSSPYKPENTYTLNSLEPIAANSPSRVNNIVTPNMNYTPNAMNSMNAVTPSSTPSLMNGTVTLAGQRYRIEGEVTLTPV